MIQAEVDFSRVLQEWDGFGVSYVEKAQTHDYNRWPQDYGGFGFIAAKESQRVLHLFFGADGLRPSIGKLFVGRWHAA